MNYLKCSSIYNETDVMRSEVLLFDHLNLVNTHTHTYRARESLGETN